MNVEQVSKEESLRRVKLSIDRQLAGELPEYFGGFGKINVVYRDHEYVYVETPGGTYGVAANGDCVHAHQIKVN